MMPSTDVNIDPNFFITPEELHLQFTYPVGRYAFSFQSTTLSFAQWRDQARAKLAELLGFQPPEAAPVQELRQTTVSNVHIHALRLTVGDDLSLPAYLLVPEQPRVGDSFTAPEFLVSRIALHHAQVVASACGLRLNDTPKAILKLRVEEASADQLRLGIQGNCKVTEHNDQLINGIVDYQICGCLHYDLKKKTFSRFELVAFGDVTNIRKDAVPPKDRTMAVGLLFELSPGDTPWQRTPPFSGGGQGAYFKAGPYFE
jgi:hypothetical protein